MNKPKQPKQMTNEEKELQVKRFFTQKREAYFQMILANALQNPNCPADWETVVDKAVETADHAIERMYPLPTETKEEAE